MIAYPVSAYTEGNFIPWFTDFLHSIFFIVGDIMIYNV